MAAWLGFGGRISDGTTLHLREVQTAVRDIRDSELRLHPQNEGLGLAFAVPRSASQAERVENARTDRSDISGLSGRDSPDGLLPLDELSAGQAINSSPDQASRSVGSPEQAIRDACSRWQDWDCNTVVRIAYCESRWKPDAVSAGEAYGVMQVLESVWRPVVGEETWAHILEVPTNVAVAHMIFERAGRTFGHWSCAS